MKPGNLYWAFCPFSDGSGGKSRPVVLIAICDDGDGIVLESRGAPHDNLDLIIEVDMDPRVYVQACRVVPGLTGTTCHFYAENLRRLAKQHLDRATTMGAMKHSDFQLIVERYKVLIPPPWQDVNPDAEPEIMDADGDA